jgi:hypothetical protein
VIATFNSDDLKRIIAKFRKIEDNLRNGKLLAVMQAVAEDYKVVVTAKMGTINARNPASPIFTYEGKSVTTRWAELSPGTIARKEKKGWKSSGMVSFWYATGAAKGATDAMRLMGFKSDDVEGYFAGISKASSKEAFEHALRTEFGGDGPGSSQWPARGLFTIANAVFLANKQKIFDKLHRALLHGVNWGS